MEFWGISELFGFIQTIEYLLLFVKVLFWNKWSILKWLSGNLHQMRQA